MSAAQIVITDCDHADIRVESELFTKEGFSYELCQCHNEDEVIAALQGVSVCLNQYAPFTARVLRSLPDLRLISHYGVGFDNIDLNAATCYGVQVCNVPDYGTYEVADHALALFMELTRRPGRAWEQVRAGQWDYSLCAPLRRLSSLCVGIVGLGRIGLAFARRVHALNCHVIGCDTAGNVLPPDVSFIERKSFTEVLTQADVLSLHCPLTAENTQMLNAQTLEQMKRGAFLINVARGALVDADALAQALKEGQLSGAALDVTFPEPLPPHSPLRSAPNIIITPHMAWYSEEAYHDLNYKCAEEAVRFFKGLPPRCPLNQPLRQ